MDICLAHEQPLKPLSGTAAERDVKSVKPLHTQPIDDDSTAASSSSASPSVAGLFDREPKVRSATRNRSGIAVLGNWPSYPASESAVSTGLSSICSSVTAEDKSEKTSDQSSTLGCSRKRTSDGSLKHARKVDVGSRISPRKAQANAKAAQSESQLLFSVPKRRGRPPKEKATPTASTIKQSSNARRVSHLAPSQGQLRPRSSIPSRLPVDVYASQCLEAARASRLDPYALHEGENELLADLLISKEITIYLNIRNSILRLWVQNPLCSVTIEEATGCAKESRFFGLAEVAYKWLVRNGYINFGCVEVPNDPISFRQSRKTSDQKTIVVVGAGVAGLTTARQLEGLLSQNSERWTDVGERPPRVVVLEGRKRIGGRVYSKPLRHQVPGSLPGDLRNTAEMGAMIVTGFEHGNPLNTIIRGQLGLRYHLMRDSLTIYDCDGRAVDETKDTLNTELYADISDRAGEFRAQPQRAQTMVGEEELINRCRDPAPDGFTTFQLEPAFDPAAGLKKQQPTIRQGRRRNAPPGTEKLTGRTRVLEDSNATQSAARAAKEMGWQLKDGVSKSQTVSLHEVANASRYPTLGTIMDEAIEQYQDIISMTPQDMRLLNWHHANLEYANAAPVCSLSLSGHDQDTGNEFEGAHSEIVGGYTQVPCGLLNLPSKLDVRLGRVVDSIHYDHVPDESTTYSTKVVCTNGEVIDANEVIMTVPLGVLKSDMIDFDPPLPGWKQDAIQRMGFGLLNKASRVQTFHQQSKTDGARQVILVYDKPFWDDSRDMFGLLNEAEHQASLNPLHYERRRGRFYLIWNASKISGRPMLVALMAGVAAHDVESTDSNALLAEINGRLRSVFAPDTVPVPLEVIVTRWKKDPFTRGTYSYVGPQTRAGDYDLIAHPVRNLHFAGEATCGTHPATVHGAFLSGLRAASEVMESIAGPIALPSPLVGPMPRSESLKEAEERTRSRAEQGMPAEAENADVSGLASALPAESSNRDEVHIKADPDTIVVHSKPPMHRGYAPLSQRTPGPPRQSVCAGDASFWAQQPADSSNLNDEAAVFAVILSRLGERPPKPARQGVNPFLAYTKGNWEECKAYCAREMPTAGRDAIRTTLGKWWRALSEEEKQPYLAQSQAAQTQADASRAEWEAKAAKWDKDANRIKQEYWDSRAADVDGKTEGAGAVEDGKDEEQ